MDVYKALHPSILGVLMSKDTFTWCWDWQTSTNCLLMHQMSLYSPRCVILAGHAHSAFQAGVFCLPWTAWSHQLCAPALEILRLGVMGDCFISSSRFIWSGKYFSLKKGQEWIMFLLHCPAQEEKIHKHTFSAVSLSLQNVFSVQSDGK